MAKGEDGVGGGDVDVECACSRTIFTASQMVPAVVIVIDHEDVLPLTSPMMCMAWASETLLRRL